MLEILLLIFLGKKIAAMAREKGYGGGGFVALLVFLWFGGEIAGAVVATIALGEGQDVFLQVYLAALAGAVCGCLLAFAIVGSLSPKQTYDDYDDRDSGRSRGRPRDDYDDRDSGRGRSRNRDDDRW